MNKINNFSLTKQNFAIFLKILFSSPDNECILQKLINKLPFKNILSRSLIYAKFVLLLVVNAFGEMRFISNLKDFIFSCIELIKLLGIVLMKSNISESDVNLLKLVPLINGIKFL